MLCLKDSYVLAIVLVLFQALPLLVLGFAIGNVLQVWLLFYICDFIICSYGRIRSLLTEGSLLVAYVLLDYQGGPYVFTK